MERRRADDLDFFDLFRFRPFFIFGELRVSALTHIHLPDFVLTVMFFAGMTAATWTRFVMSDHDFFSRPS